MHQSVIILNVLIQIVMCRVGYGIHLYFKDEWIWITVVKYLWAANKETPNFTGIPPYVVLLSKLQSLLRQTARFKKDFRGVLVDEL